MPRDMKGWVAHRTAGAADAAGADRSGRPRHTVLWIAGVVYHHHHLDLAGFLRQHLNYGRAAALLRRLSSGSNAVHTAPSAWYLRLITSPFGGHSIRRSIALTALLAIAQVATPTGTLWPSDTPAPLRGEPTFRRP